MNRFLNLVYFWATENADEKDLNRFKMRLNTPDAKRAKRAASGPDSPWSKQNEENSLALFTSQLQGVTSGA
jgi:hypothetical protein